MATTPKKTLPAAAGAAKGAATGAGMGAGTGASGITSTLMQAVLAANAQEAAGRLADYEIDYIASPPLDYADVAGLPSYAKGAAKDAAAGAAKDAAMGAAMGGAPMPQVSPPIYTALMQAALAANAQDPRQMAARLLAEAPGAPEEGVPAPVGPRADLPIPR
jgi:hypothetical protein